MQAIKNYPTTVDDFIASYPEDLQEILIKIRAVIKEAAPDAEEKISYHMPAYEFHGKLIYFNLYKHHIGLYPKTAAMQDAIEELSAFKGTKSSVHLPLDKPIPYELISKIVKFRVAENLKQSRLV